MNSYSVSGENQQVLFSIELQTIVMYTSPLGWADINEIHRYFPNLIKTSLYPYFHQIFYYVAKR